MVATMVSYGAVLLAFVAGAYAQVPCQPRPVCNLDELAKCQSSFDITLGINAALNISQYAQLQDSIEGVIAAAGAPGVGGLDQVCGALRQFKTCFTDPRDYDRCMFNPLGLVGDSKCQPTGISEQQARGFVRLYSSLDFACGFGFSHFYNAEDQHPGCMTGTFKDKIAVLHQCQDEFDNQGAQNPSQQCTFVSQSTSCFRRAFQSCGEQGSWFGCEFQRMGLQAAYGNCGQEYCKFGL